MTSFISPLSEWLASGVDPDLIALNIQTLSGDTPYQYLLYEINAASGRVHPDAQWRWARKHYSHIEHGGWWCNGLDPLNNWQPMYWGCFKPHQPRNTFDPKGKIKPVKYEHPPKTPTRAFFLQVPDHIWAKVAARYGVPIDPEDLGDGERGSKGEGEQGRRGARERGRRGDGERKDENLSSASSPCSPSATPTSSPNQPQFWQWVWDNNIPVIIVEGAKKAGCLLTLGYAAIALPGVTGGVRTKTPQGEKCDPYLIPELQHFATEERSIYICFDRDSKRQTVQNVNREIGKLGRLFTAAKCPVKVINLPGPEKGVDDFVVSKGSDAFSALKNEAQGFQFWLDRESWLLTYPASLKLNSRYLGKLPYPESGLACIKAPKGTGKTQALTNLVSQSLSTGDRRVLIITHRIQLGRAICASLGINYIDETRDSAEGKLFGYGLCIDSLHPLSQAKFNPEDWFGAIVIIDECEQVIWHALNSSTCRENRVAILQTLQELIHNVLTSGGLVVAQDADLSDYSIDYLIAIAGIPISPWVVINEWQPKRGRDVTFFATSNPASLYVQMEQILSQQVTCCDIESRAECCPISLNCAEFGGKNPAECSSESPVKCCPVIRGEYGLKSRAKFCPITCAEYGFNTRAKCSPITCTKYGSKSPTEYCQKTSEQYPVKCAKYDSEICAKYCQKTSEQYPVKCAKYDSEICAKYGQKTSGECPVKPAKCDCKSHPEYDQITSGECPIVKGAECDCKSHPECDCKSHPEYYQKTSGECPIVKFTECDSQCFAKYVSENPSEYDCKNPAKCDCETTAQCSPINFTECNFKKPTESHPIERYRPRIMVVEDSQKVTGNWSCRNLETQLQKRFPHQRILRIDSESVSDPNHPAYGCIDQLNTLIQNYDIIIASPTIGTGVSIDLRHHFTAVFGIFKGAIAVNDALQALARVRDETVPWFVWTAPFGVGKIGNGSSSYQAILKSQKKVITTNLKLLQGVDFDINEAYDPIHLRTWAKMGARINAGMWNYREAIWEALKAEGHSVSLCRENQLQQELKVLLLRQLAANNAQNWDLLEELESQDRKLKSELDSRETVAACIRAEATSIKEENKLLEAQAVNSASDITFSKYLELKDKRAKTRDELNQQRKYQLQETYGVPITPELKLKDDAGWLPQIRLHYYLIYDPELVRFRDKNHLAGHLERGQGKVCPQDLRLLTASVEALKALGIKSLFNVNREYRGTDADVIAFAEQVKQCSVDIKDFLGISVSPQMTPMEVVQYILRGKLGFTLRRVRQERSEERDAKGRPKRIRVYQFEFPQDGREAIFEVWQQRDKEAVSAEGARECLEGVSSGTGSDNSIEMSGGVPPLGLSQQINEVGTAGTGSDNNIEISEVVPPLGFPQQNNEVGTVGTGSDNNIGMSEGVFSQDLPQQNNEVGTAGTGSDNNIEISEGVSPLDEEWAHTTQVFGVEAAPGETLTTEEMGVAASYQAIEPETHAIPTYEVKVPQIAPSELKVGSVVRFCGEVQKYVVRAVSGAQVMVKSLFSGQFVNTYAHRLELAEGGTG
ncbi:plasmid replication protein, CyRepA1 family [Microcoleus sp. B9-D4]|uniref:plasmid replication protein, CyRepA1 family n=1 Tax=Microcoleus sp. B9-D4 TaxID=2818711 RepID=UPI002FD2ADDE